MKTSRRLSYALRAVLDLAAPAARGRVVRSAAIAERAAIPEKYLEAILADLSRAGVIESRRGPDGGHRLARPASQITVAEVRDAVDGALRLGEADARRSRVPPHVELALRELWQGLEQRMNDYLSAVSIEELRRRAESRRSVIDFSI